MLLKQIIVLFTILALHRGTEGKEAVIKNGTMDKGWYLTAFKTIDRVGTLWSDPKRENEDFVHVCGAGTDFWLITPYLSLTHAFADVIYVDIDVEITSDCDPEPCDNFHFEVYLNYSQQKVDVTKTKDFLMKNFQFVYNVSDKTKPSGRQVKTFTFSKRGEGGVTFAIRSQGACGTLYKMKMYYFFCEQKYISGLRLAKTITPVRGTTQVEAQCSEHSSPWDDTSRLLGYCTRDGKWLIDNSTKCFCDAGFTPRKGQACRPCGVGFYKPTSSNQRCYQCPRNNVATVDRKACRCREGYYSFYEQHLKPSVCHPLPRYALKLNIGYIDSNTINLTWSPPNSTMLKYEVVCNQCGKTSCNKPCPKVQYIPHRQHLTQTFVKISNLESRGSYVFKVYPINNVNRLADKTKWNFTHIRYQPASVLAGKTQEDTHFEAYIYVIAAACIVLFLTVIILVAIIIRRRVNFKRGLLLMNSTQMSELPSAGQRMYIDPTIYDSPEEALNEFTCELEKSEVSLEMLIGGGEFGDVYKGQMCCKDKNTFPVAIKTLKQDANAKSVKDFLLEASVMAQFHDPNVINLQGVITKSTPQMIVIEFMANGSLDHFLQNNDNKLSKLQLISMARGVASGMKYLSGINFVHRDLAARNVLVNEKLLCKISDFGLSRALETEGECRGEYSTSGGKIPIRWTAPEAIGYRKFSSASDVWSYGILLWEIMTFGQRPYGQWNNYTVMKQVDEGFRLPAPQGCPSKVHALMERCWKANREERPTFADILLIIDTWIRSPDTVYSYMDPSNNLKQWLKSIKMETYMCHMTAAGYLTPLQLIGLHDKDLLDMGITLIGHRNKILKSVKTLEHNIHLKERTSSVTV